MDTTERKKKIFEAGLRKHLAVIEDFRQRIRDMMANDGNVNEEEYDSQVQAQKAETGSEVSMINEQLEFANRELDDLKRVESTLNEPMQVVSPGAVVVTGDRTFFVSASLEEFTAGKEKVYGISTKSPLYQAMKGKQVGDSFRCQGALYTIMDLL